MATKLGTGTFDIITERNEYGQWGIYLKKQTNKGTIYQRIGQKPTYEQAEQEANRILGI